MNTENLHVAPSVGEFLTCCEQSIVNVLSQALGAKWDSEILSAPTESSAADEVRLGFELGKGLAGNIEFALTIPDAERLGTRFMGVPRNENTQWNGELEESVTELFRQIAGELATRLTGKYGDTSVKSSAMGNSTATITSAILIKSTDRCSVRIDVRISQPLLASLTKDQRSDNAPPSFPCDSVRDRNLELLMGVSLSATLRFGNKRLPLRDVLDLNSGSVIELDRQVHEPVDLLLDGKIVARGEVVIVDGSYGLRVTEVASERIRAELLQ